MIYYQTGVKTHGLEIMNSSARESSPKTDFQTLLNYTPRHIDFNSLDEVESFKVNHLQYFIAGKFSQPIRKNENLENRSLLVLDFDQIDNERQFFMNVAKVLKDIAFYAYPSISYGFKGIRWRLVILINTPYAEDDHRTLLKWASHELGFTPDEKATQWAQLMSLPVLNIHTDRSKLIFHGGESLNIIEIIARANGADDIDKAIAHNRAKKVVNKDVTNGYFRVKKYTGKLLDMIVKGATEGSRNDYVTRLCGKLFYAGAEPETVYNMLIVTNENFITPPLDDREINTIFNSIFKREARR